MPIRMLPPSESEWPAHLDPPTGRPPLSLRYVLPDEPRKPATTLPYPERRRIYLEETGRA